MDPTFVCATAPPHLTTTPPPVLRSIATQRERIMQNQRARRTAGMSQGGAASPRVTIPLPPSFPARAPVCPSQMVDGSE
jgi:hypothetical protein